MLYLISGASRSGKTYLARKLFAARQIPYLSLDWLMMGFNDGLPACGIHHLLWPDEIARKMWPFVQAMLESMLLEDIDYVIEGEALLPEQVAALTARHPGRVRAVFMGYTQIGTAAKVALVKRHSDAANDWLTTRADDYIYDHIGNMIEYSTTVKQECQVHGLPYVDTSLSFAPAIEKASEYLLGDRN